MSARRKKTEDCPKPKERKIRSSCIYCVNGYVQIGTVTNVTMECGYCLGTGFRNLK